jgi:phosphoglycerate kinase
MCGKHYTKPIHLSNNEGVKEMQKRTLKEIEVKDKRVFLRVDFNVPMDKQGNITDDSRIKAALSTIKYLLENEAKVIICSHLGRPDGAVVEELRLASVADRLSKLLGKSVKALPESVGPEVERAVSALSPGEALLLENIRFHPEEESNDPEFARDLSRLADVFVNDAFGASHRAHASVVGVAQYLPAVPGFLMEKEIEALSGALENPKRPFAVVLGGAKVSGKIAVLENLVNKVDALLIGGGMAATFLKSKGYEVGSSRVENDRLDYVKNLGEKANSKKVKIILPKDVVVAQKLEAGVETKTVPIDVIQKGWLIGDIGSETIDEFSNELRKCQTVVWNGPLGVFEIPEFANGTLHLIKILAELQATTVIGGGSTAEAVMETGLADRMSHVSTGGGASLEFLEGKTLPGVAALQDRPVGIQVSKKEDL